jgi:hypothetical protein
MEANGREAQHLEGSRLVGWQLPEITPELFTPVCANLPETEIF